MDENLDENIQNIVDGFNRDMTIDEIRHECSLNSNSIETGSSNGGAGTSSEVDDIDKEIKNITLINFKPELVGQILDTMRIQSLHTCNLHVFTSTINDYTRSTLIGAFVNAELMRKFNLTFNLELEKLEKLIKNFTDPESENRVIARLLSDSSIQFQSCNLHDDISIESIIKKIKCFTIILKNIICITHIWRQTMSMDDIMSMYVENYRSIFFSSIMPLHYNIEEIRQSALNAEARIPIIDISKNPVFHSTTRSETSHLRRIPSNNFIDSNTCGKGNSDSFNRPSSGDSVHLLTSRNGSSDHGSVYPIISELADSQTQITFNQLSSIIRENYGNNKDIETSTALDIIALYLKGQKMLYSESKNYAERYLNLLMIPAIILSVLIGLFTFIFKDNRSAIITIACISAVETTILAVVAYLKLDARTEAHKIAAYNFEKLETKCSFKSGRILFFDESEAINISELVTDIENKVIEIKELNQFLIPEHIRSIYPHTYSTNIFSEVKKLYIGEAVLKNKLRNTINKIIMERHHRRKTGHQLRDIHQLELLQDRQFNDVLEYKRRYLELDSQLRREIEENIKVRTSGFLHCYSIINILTCGLYRNAINSSVNKKIPSSKYDDYEDPLEAL